MYISNNLISFNLICILSYFSNARLRHYVFYLFSSRFILSIWYISLSSISNSIYSCASDSALTLLFSCRRNSYITKLIIELLSFCLLNLFLVAGSCLWSLAGLLLKYLEPKSPKNLHSCDEYLGPWVRQVCVYLTFRWSTYLFMRFTELSLISE